MEARTFYKPASELVMSAGVVVVPNIVVLVLGVLVVVSGLLVVVYPKVVDIGACDVVVSTAVVVDTKNSQ